MRFEGSSRVSASAETTIQVWPFTPPTASWTNEVLSTGIMPTPLRERKHLRRFSQPWFFVSLVTLAIAISYFDRQALPVVISAIERTIPISDARFAVLQASFLAAYALLYAGGVSSSM